jgi:hypothetical protein
VPTLLRILGYRIGFFANEGTEPAHVHVQREPKQAKYWLVPVVRLASNAGFAQRELSRIRLILEEYRDFLMEQWNERPPR